MTDARSDHLPRVTGAMFYATSPSRGRLHVQVQGENFVMRAVPLVARVGDQFLDRISIRSDGNGFAGVLDHAPNTGDRLFVGYTDTELRPTSVVYGQPDSTPEPVA